MKPLCYVDFLMNSFLILSIVKIKKFNYRLFVGCFLCYEWHCFPRILLNQAMYKHLEQIPAFKKHYDVGKLLLYNKKQTYLVYMTVKWLIIFIIYNMSKPKHHTSIHFRIMSAYTEFRSFHWATYPCVSNKCLGLLHMQMQRSTLKLGLD